MSAGDRRESLVAKEQLGQEAYSLKGNKVCFVHTYQSRHYSGPYLKFVSIGIEIPPCYNDRCFFGLLNPLHDEENIRVYFLSALFLSTTFSGTGVKLTQRMTTTQLRFLRILCTQFISNTIQKSHITLSRILLHCRYESPGHSSRRLTSN